MPQPNNRYEQQFLDALKSIFIGAKVEGESGYINLMKIKASYFEKGVFPRLMQDIDAVCKSFETSFREELFDKLYDFFRHYFSESGSLYFSSTAQHHNIFEKIYTDDRDVMLFWKTHMLYYVKTDRLFNSIDVKVDDERFFFDVSGMELKRANERRELTYAFKSLKNGKITLTVDYSENGRKTKPEEIIGAVAAKGLTLAEETLHKALAVFQKQSEVDYFINKNAKAFLEEQFDLWLYQYVFKGESAFTEMRLKQLQAIKAIAYKIIEFIAQFEDELVRVWNKPKLALNSNYVITLDRIVGKDETLLKQVFKHKGMKGQLAEWKELGLVDEEFKLNLISEKNLFKETANPQYQHLPLDTKYFKDLELDILAQFDDLDAALDGWLIHSENYQALTTLLPKFKESVQTVYIDPPFNTGDDFEYVDHFQDSTWLSILSSRLDFAKRFLRASGSIYLHLDWNANHLGRMLLDSIFGAEGFVNEIVWRIGWVSGYKTQAKGFVRNHDTIFLYARDPEKHSFYKERSLIPYRSFEKETIAKQIERIEETWDIQPDSIRSTKVTFIAANGHVYKLGLEGKDGNYYMEDTWNSNEYEELHSNKIKRNPKEYTPNGSTITQKPEELLKRALEVTTDRGDLVMDFFSGSGTTVAVAHKLGRKWIGVEMGSYFQSDMLFRMKHVLAGISQREPVGISKMVDWKGGGFFKYYDLEQYEDTLRSAHYEDAPLFAGTQAVYTSYVFLRDLKLLEAVKVDRKQNKVEVNLEKLYPGIDLAETLSCLTGKRIKRITKDAVEFRDGTSTSLSAPIWDDVKRLIWW